MLDNDTRSSYRPATQYCVHGYYTGGDPTICRELEADAAYWLEAAAMDLIARWPIDYSADAAYLPMEEVRE